MDTDRVSTPPPPLAVGVALALLCGIWGSTWLVIKAGLADLPPLTAAALRFALAAAVFVLVAGWVRRREGGERPPLWLALVMGGLNFAASYAIVYWGETVIPSGLAAVLWAVFPIMVALLGHMTLPAERLHARHWVGFAAGFAGVALLFATDLAGIGPRAVWMGAVFLLSPLVSAIGQITVKRHASRASSALLNRDGLAVGALLLAALALAFERGEPVRWSRVAVFSIAYLAVAGTVVTFGLYYWLLRWLPAYRLSLIAYVIPAIALLLGWAFGGEAVGLHTLAGAALVVGGCGLVLRRTPAREHPAAPARVEPPP